MLHFFYILIITFFEVSWKFNASFFYILINPNFIRVIDFIIKLAKRYLSL